MIIRPTYLIFFKNVIEFIFKKMKVMRHDLVSPVKRTQMDLNSCLSTYVDKKTAPSKVVTGVVPATMSPMPKSERGKCFLKYIE